MRSALSPVTAIPPASEGEHFYWLDWLRFLAAAAVVVDHTREFNWSAWPPPAHGGAHRAGLDVFFSLTHLGEQAVVVFFVLSGWLVGGKAFARARQGTFDAAAYAADRLSRVYVPLVPALLLTAAVVRGYDLPFHPTHYLACLVGLQSAYVETPFMNIPLWTLAYELWFYALAGCTAAVCTRRISLAGRIGAGAGVVLALGMLRQRELTYLCCWLLGAAGYMARAGMPGRRRWVGTALAAMAAGTWIEQVRAGVLPGVSPAVAAWMPGQPVARLLLAAGAVGLVAGLTRMRPATRAGAWVERLGTTFAAFSYTLYLTHCPTLWFLALPTTQMPPVLDGASVGRACVWMAACVVVALGMYALFEARTLAVRRGLRARFTGTPPAARMPSRVDTPRPALPFPVT